MKRVANDKDNEMKRVLEHKKTIELECNEKDEEAEVHLVSFNSGIIYTLAKEG